MRQQHEEDDLFTRERINRIFRVFTALTRDPSLAEDLTQNLFTEVFRSIRRFDPRMGSFDAWVNGFVPVILVRERARTGRRPLVVPLQPEDEDRTAGDLCEDAQRRDALQRAFGQLSLRDRELLLRRHVGQSVEEIAEAMGLAVSAVTTALSRARRRLRELLDEAGHPIPEGAL